MDGAAGDQKTIVLVCGDGVDKPFRVKLSRGMAFR